MRRRGFIGLLGGAAVWPLSSHAQQPATRRVGMLIGYAEDDPETKSRLAAFRPALHDADGWKDATSASTIGLLLAVQVSFNGLREN
jgi:putative tryptophan/tyrosine transport system substrate-binding protein